MPFHSKQIKMLTVISAFLFLFVCPLAFGQERLSIAVMDFKVTNVSKDEVDLLIDFLNNALFETGVFDVVQRGRRDLLIKELEFSYSDAADTQKTKQIGKLLASKLLLFGSVGKIGRNILFNITTVDVETGKTVSTYSKPYKGLEEIINDFPQITGEIAVISSKAAFLKKARVLYLDDFSSEDWISDERLFYSAGKYHIYSLDEDWWIWQADSFDDFVYEAEAQWIDGDTETGFGLIFRLQDENNFYLFDITQSGYFKVDKMIDEYYHDVTGWERSSAINSTEINYLKVEAVGNHLSFYINNFKVKDLFDNTFRKGKFGLFAGSEVHVSFDNVKIYQGSLLFTNTFSDDSEGWIQDSSAYIQEGEYIMRAAGDGYFSWKGDSLGNISYQAEVRWLAGSVDSGYGLVFYLQDIDNNYSFVITRDGYYMLARYLNGEWQTLIDWKKSRKINEQGKNILKVECIEKLIRLYINNNLVEKFEDSTFREGRIGFVSYNDVHASFDNVEVFLLD